MKTVFELQKTLRSFCRMDVHVHTHLCDGKPEMTVRAIAERAEKKELDGVILTPHFHKRVSDESETLYTDTNVKILQDLREEINEYENNGGKVKILLSAEVDILSVAGDLALSPSKEAEEALDLITPTMNYNPILPLHAVHLTYGKDIDSLHDSGEYTAMVKNAGGIEPILEAMYEAEAQAILRSPYPCMLGHFFAAHAMATRRYNWFGIKEMHLPILKGGGKRVVEACKRVGASIDITGIHMFPSESIDERKQLDGFLHEFQCWFLEECRKADLIVCPGSDAHSLTKVGDSLCYYELFRR